MFSGINIATVFGTMFFWAYDVAAVTTPIVAMALLRASSMRKGSRGC